jgi:hypothetical protein
MKATRKPHGERIRIHGAPALRLRKLHERTFVAMDRLAQMVAECGIAAVEQRFKS